ncbi:MAG: SDR family NAD(P)-dependent oxidoreductase [Proteobacteria bacterium]|nr:SDR family NAD(P)-dependent oxidoreductase [Pseudomonadota bacterium]
MIFNDKTVIITGGSEGVGAATARMFADAGANLMLVARDKKKLDAIAEELRQKTRVEVFAMDVSNAEACVDVFKKASFEFGRVDVLVNNAGYHKRGNVEDVDASDLGNIINVNLKAPIMLSRIALPYLRESGGGAIINVGSLAGRAPIPGSAAYAASKAGLRSFTYALGMELAGSGIKLAVVSPGPIDTGFIMADIDATSDLTFSQPISTAEEVAQAILDLCGNNVREQSMPKISGWLTMIMYLFPGLNPRIRPMLERRGAKVKARLRAERKRRESDSPDH